MMLQLELLWNLQKIDSKIKKIKNDQENKQLYNRLCAIRDEYNTKKVLYKEQTEKYEKNKKLIVRLNMDLKHLDERVKENAKRLYVDGSNLKIVENLQKEIDANKKKIEEIEDRLLELMEANEKVESERASVESRMAELKTEFEELKKQYTAECEKNKEDLKALMKNRDELTRELDSSLAMKYHEIASKKSKALSRVAEGICTECGFKLNAILYDKLMHKKNEICYCDHCGRILYIGE